VHVRSLSPRGTILAIAAMVGIGVVSLWWFGQPLTCTCGSVSLWVGDINSSQNSQQVADPYSFTHISHGLLFFGLLWPLRRRVDAGTRLVLATAVEVAWEIVENSPLVIERYREATISLGYRGDSVLNSTSDVLMCVIGFALASRLPGRLSAALIVASEVVLALTIRDGLLINVVMLLYPVPALRDWQLAR
jgi:hypothetical protein